MSSTMVVTTAQATTKLRTDHSSANCPSCGCDLPPPPPQKTSSYNDLSSAQVRITELESQVRQLNERASSAVTRWAEYEAELVKLRSQQPATSKPSSSSSVAPAVASQQSPTRTSFLQSGTTRLSSLLYPRKSTSNMRSNSASSSGETPTLRTASNAPGSPGVALSPTGHATPVTPSKTASMAEELLEALTKEQSLRQEAEGRLTATSREVEELSASLFEQANEMVADERRARAKLEERVDELERRDFEKRQRLERLENAMERIERVKNLLQQ